MPALCRRAAPPLRGSRRSIQRWRPRCSLPRPALTGDWTEEVALAASRTQHSRRPSTHHTEGAAGTGRRGVEVAGHDDQQRPVQRWIGCEIGQRMCLGHPIVVIGGLVLKQATTMDSRPSGAQEHLAAGPPQGEATMPTPASRPEATAACRLGALMQH